MRRFRPHPKRKAPPGCVTIEEFIRSCDALMRIRLRRRRTARERGHRARDLATGPSRLFVKPMFASGRCLN